MKKAGKKLGMLFLAVLVVLMLTPLTAYGETLPCGHDSSDPGDHSPADCYVPGHYNCDGKTHGENCYDELLEAYGNIPGVDIDTDDEDDPDPTSVTMPGDQPDTPDTPPEPPPEPPVPEGKEPPSEPPIEIEVDPDLDADLTLNEDKLKELAKKTSWTISFKNKSDTAKEKNNPQWFDVTHTINLTATKQSGEDMYGTYNAKGTMKGVCDATRFEQWSLAMAGGGGMIDTVDMSGEGPLDSFTFELVDDFPAEGPNALAPLMPSGSAKDITVSWPGQSSMYVHVEEYIQGAQGSDTYSGEWTSDLTFTIVAYESGKAVLTVDGLSIMRPAKFFGSVTKKVDWKQVK